MADKEDLARAVERLCEDEALRGDLSDDGFGPLLDWGIAALKAHAVTAKDSAAMEQFADEVSDLVRQAVAAAEAGAVEDPRALVHPAMNHKDEVLRRLKALRLGDDADANAVQIAALLQTTLPPVSPAKTVRPGSGKQKPPDKPTAPRS